MIGFLPQALLQRMMLFLLGAAVMLEAFTRWCLRAGSAIGIRDHRW
jgi:hypothetical protein